MIYYTLIWLVLLLFILIGIEGLNESCNRNSDCDIKNAMCMGGKCNCDDLSYYNGTLCLPYATEYKAFCYERAQCEWLGDNSVCTNNRCVCQNKFRWYKGKCQAYVDKGEKCTSNDDCYNGYDLLSLTCSFGTCRCSSNYYDRGYDCRKNSMLLGDCALTIDCKPVPIVNIKSVCALGKCALNNTIENSQFYAEELGNEETTEPKLIFPTDVQENLSCAKDDDCTDMANSLCDPNRGTCGCVEETHYLHDGNCVLGFNKCDNNEECTTNAMCFKNSCVCQRGFFMKQKQCIAELGMLDPNVEYKNDSECPIKPGKLSGSICYCKDYWFNDEINRNCIKTMIESVQSCLTNDWCDAMGPYSFCNSSTGKCECSSFAKLNNSTFYCEKFEEKTEDICLRDNECNINERCLNERCECIDNFSRNEDNLCVPNIGASCEIVSCAHIGDSSCVAKTCKCDQKYVGKNNRCLKIADNLQDNCEEEEQCQNLEHTVCGATKEEESLACICAEEYTAINNTCYQSKKYGDPCTTAADCTRVLNHSYQCRNSLCQCAVGFELKNGYCTSSASTIFGSCVLLFIIVLKLVIS